MRAAGWDATIQGTSEPRRRRKRPLIRPASPPAALCLLQGVEGAEAEVAAAEREWSELQWRKFDIATRGAGDADRRAYRSLVFNLTTQRQLLRQVGAALAGGAMPMPPGGRALCRALPQRGCSSGPPPVLCCAAMCASKPE